MKKITLKSLGKCDRTISGNHMPMTREDRPYTITFFCSGCGKIDDTGKFLEYIYYKNTGKELPKVNDLERTKHS